MNAEGNGGRKSASRPLKILAGAVWAILASAPAALGGPGSPDAGVTSDSGKKAESILAESLSKYRKLSSYQDSVEVTFIMVAKDADGEDGGQEHTRETSLFFDATKGLCFESQDLRIVRNADSTYLILPNQGQYREIRNSSKKRTIREMDDSPFFVSQMLHPVMEALMRPEASIDELFPQLKSLKLETPPGVADESTIRISGSLSIEMMPRPVNVEIVLDPATLMLGELRFDMTASYKEMMGSYDEIDEDIDDVEEKDASDESDEEEDEWTGPPKLKIESARLIAKFKDIRTNEQIPESQFAFKPDDALRKVKQFQMGGFDQRAQQKLIGKPAPAIVAQDFDDKSFSLGEEKNRVVLLDFWATWCGPCIQAMPHVQKIADRFKDKPVTILGVNRDSEGSRKRVLNFLAKKEISFRQLKDFDGKIAQAYKVTGIPCTVLIDGNGIVQFIQTGFTGEESLIDQIEQLLRGESLFNSEDLIAESDEGEEPDSDFDDMNPDDESLAREDESREDDSNTKELNPSRLVRVDSLSPGISGHLSREIDLDGDGRPELVSSGTGMEPCLIVFSPTKSKPRRIFLRGAGQGSLSSFCPVKCKGEWNWLVVVTMHSGWGARSTSTAALFDDKGKRIWKYKPKFGKKANSTLCVAAGDLTSDGEPEYVIGITSYTPRKTGSNSWTHENAHAYLAILDSEGQLISLRSAGQNVQSVHVIEAGSPGEQATIICGDFSTIRKYKLKAESPHGRGHGRKSSDVAVEDDSENEPTDDASRTCRGNLRGLGQAFLIYAHFHNDRFPAEADAVIIDNHATEKQFRCPAGKCGVSGEESCYEYIPNQAAEGHPDNVVLFERVANHGKDGAFVLFFDSRVEFVQPYSKVKRLVEKTRERLREAPPKAVGASANDD